MRQTDLFAIPPFNIRTLNFRYTFFVCKILWAIIRRNINFFADIAYFLHCLRFVLVDAKWLWLNEWKNWTIYHCFWFVDLRLNQRHQTLDIAFSLWIKAASWSMSLCYKVASRRSSKQPPTPHSIRNAMRKPCTRLFDIKLLYRGTISRVPR